MQWFSVLVPGPAARCPTLVRSCACPSLLHLAFKSIRIAVSNIEVSNEEWKCAAKGKGTQPSLTLERYQRLNALLDAVAECKERPDYVVLPECSLPRRWERNTVMRTLGRGVSLIAGLEYRIEPDNAVHNDAIIALNTTFLGYPFWLPLLQAKAHPAYRENIELKKLGKHWAETPSSHPVYWHNGFCFGVLICSELTDIRNRLRFQGHVDALFVPAWNQDIETFTTLIESSALDIHATIVQANNRKYGDSRIRAPMKSKHHKDILRTQGGMNDFFVIGEVDYKNLRDFQTRTPFGGNNTDTFKPVPAGFTVSDIRKSNAAE